MKTPDDDDYDTLHLAAMVVVLTGLMLMVFALAGAEVMECLA